MTFPPHTRTLPSRHVRESRTPVARHGQGLLAFGVLVLVVVADQGTKWWAWRHLHAVLNGGSTWFLGSTVSSWCSGALRGALLDVVGAQALTLALGGLLRRRRPPAILLPALLTIGGWGSNLLDRLGLHLLTAPGEDRGAIDFLHLGPCCCNVADLCIAAGTVLFGVGLYRRHRGHGSAVRRSVAGRLRPLSWRRTGRWALLGALAPALLGTTLTLTTSGGHVAAATAPVIRLLDGGASASAAAGRG